MSRVVALLVALSLVATAGAQSPARPTLGILEPGPADRPSEVLTPLKEKLRELGWRDGETLTIEVRYADGKHDRLADLAAELVRLGPDVLYTHSTGGARAMKDATSTIPVVIGVGGDLVAQRIVATLARPGGNVTGMTLLSRELEVKRLELLRDVVPKLARVTSLSHPAVPPSPLLEETAHAMGIQLRRVTVRAPHELEVAFAAIAGEGTQAVLVEESAMLAASLDRLTALGVKHRLPTLSRMHGFADAGGLFEFGPDTTDLARRSAVLVDRILKGAKPADLPVESTRAFQLIANARTAGRLGVTIPPPVLARAGRVIR